jgi:hypothetical protein
VNKPLDADWTAVPAGPHNTILDARSDPQNLSIINLTHDTKDVLAAIKSQGNVAAEQRLHPEAAGPLKFDPPRNRVFTALSVIVGVVAIILIGALCRRRIAGAN